jgi:hypothetical protein
MRDLSLQKIPCLLVQFHLKNKESCYIFSQLSINEKLKTNFGESNILIVLKREAGKSQSK